MNFSVNERGVIHHPCFRHLYWSAQKVSWVSNNSTNSLVDQGSLDDVSTRTLESFRVLWPRDPYPTRAANPSFSVDRPSLRKVHRGLLIYTLPPAFTVRTGSLVSFITESPTFWVKASWSLSGPSIPQIPRSHPQFRSFVLLRSATSVHLKTRPLNVLFHYFYLKFPLVKYETMGCLIKRCMVLGPYYLENLNRTGTSQNYVLCTKLNIFFKEN